jgi:pimeloyl-[acyl-carrier protein] synthase
MNNPLLWRPLDKDYIRDPYTMYEQLRSTDPVYLAQTKEYIITRYDDVKEILKSSSFESGNRLSWLKRGVAYFDNKDEDLRAIYQAMNSFILMLNNEHHLRIRNFVAKAWNNREVDGIIRENTGMLLKEMKGKDLDFVSAYAQPLPVYTISRILGIPVADCQHLIQLGVAMTKTLDLYISLKDLVLMNRAAADFISFFQEQIKIKYDRPDEGLLSRMIQKNRTENHGLSEEELVSIAIFLFTAGEETSASLISNTMLNLLKHPDQLAQLRQQPDLIELAIEEVLRYDSIVQLLGRVAKEEVTIRGKVIPADATVTLVVASANRDENTFQQADQFIISRNPNRHLSFGSGVHYCLGDWLGRRQSQLAVQMFLNRFPTITLPDQELTWYKNLAVRRLNALQIHMT